MALSASYTPQATMREDQWTEKFAAANGVTYNSGDIVQRPNGMAAVVIGLRPITGSSSEPSLDQVTVSYIGGVDVLSASGTVFADGASVYWDSTNKLAVTTLPTTGGYYLGTARGAKASGTTSVRVMLNAIEASADTLSPVATLAATGTTLAGAAQIASLRTFVTGANGVKAVKLPAPAADLSVTIINEANFSLPIIANAAETIDGLSAGFNIPGICTVTLRSDGTNWYSQRGFLTNGLTSIDTGAPLGTNLGTGYQIIGQFYYPAAGGIDGTKGAVLPAAAAGLELTLVNDSGASALKIYSSSGTINGTSGSTAYSLAAGKVGYAVSDGTNWRILSA